MTLCWMPRRVGIARGRKNDDDINRCHSPLSVVSKSKIAQQQISKAISRRKRHFVTLQVIGRRCKDIVYHCSIVRQRSVRRDVSIVSPRLARAYNPWQHFCEIIRNYQKLSQTFKIIHNLSDHNHNSTSLVKDFSSTSANFFKTSSQYPERAQSARGRKLFSSGKIGKLSVLNLIKFNSTWKCSLDWTLDLTSLH